MAMIEVLAPGWLTTVQDLGRFGYGHFGVSPGGAADALALRVANLLVGNAEGAPALEITLGGLRLRIHQALRLALAGADLGARVDGRDAPLHRAIAVAAGAELEFAGGTGGARVYLALAGGIAMAPALGSASTDLRGGFGGLEGRALVTGDRLAVAAPPRAAPPLGDVPPNLRARHATLRVLPGVHGDAFADGARRRLVEEAFQVRGDSDRMGVRLAGPPLENIAPGELLSEGVAPGAVQVPPGGAPIVLGVDHPATGGYPQIAHVIAADLPSLAQLRPHQAVRFAWVEQADARAALLAQEKSLRDWQRRSG